MNHFVIVAFVKKDFPQSFAQTDWPLHVTIVRPFFSEKNAEEFSKVLKEICSNFKSIQTEGKSLEMFGEKNDAAVTELQNVPELQALHDRVMGGCGEWMEFKTRQFDTYRPHVTDQKENKIEVGEKV